MPISADGRRRLAAGGGRAPRFRRPLLAALAALGVLAPAGDALAVRTAEAARRESGELKTSGVRAYETGQLSKAIADLSQAIDINLNDFFAHFYLGLALKESRRFPEAQEILEVARELDPRYLQVYIALGEAALGLGDTQSARTHFQEALNRQDNYAPALNRMGVLAEALGRTDDAVARFKEAIAANPGFPDPYVHLGAVYRRQGRTADAIELFQEAIRYRPDFAEAYRFLGRAYGDLDRRTEAIALLEKAISLEPESADFHVDLGRLLASWDDRTQARLRFEQALALDPKHLAARLGLADLLRRDGRYPEAMAMLDEALAEGGVRDERVQADLVAVRDAYRTAQERVRAARERIDAGGTGASLPPEEAGSAHLELARHLHEAGDRAGALHHCEQALGNLGRAADLLFECGYYALLHRQYGLAAGMLEESLGASPADDRARVDLGIAYLRLGRLTSAAEAFRRAREANPQSIPAVLYHGNALYRLRRLADAEEAYREVLRLGAPGDLAQQIERLLIQIEEDRLPPREPAPGGSGAQR